MDFDFTMYLSSLLSIPSSQITIQFLLGGFLNAVVRASFSPPVDLTQFGHSQSVTSVVLKYAPPYMASDPSIPLDTIRQDIEARALMLLDPKSESALPVSSLFLKYPNIKIPQFIHHDFEERVLIMTDLGSSIVAIDNWLAQEPGPSPEDVARIAKDLGRFTAEFVILTSEPDAEVLSLLPSNSGMKEYVVNNLTDVFLTHGVHDAETLIERMENATRDSREMESCLGMVDLWRNNIVIDSDKNVCIMDWEYFGLSNASCDISMLGAFFLFIFARYQRHLV
jgi:hypothetical protein